MKVLLVQKVWAPVKVEFVVVYSDCVSVKIHTVQLHTIHLSINPGSEQAPASATSRHSILRCVARLEPATLQSPSQVCTNWAIAAYLNAFVICSWRKPNIWLVEKFKKLYLSICVCVLKEHTYFCEKLFYLHWTFIAQVHIQICTYSNFVHNLTLFDTGTQICFAPIYYNNRSKNMNVTVF